MPHLLSQYCHWNRETETISRCGRQIMNAGSFRIKKLVPNLAKTLFNVHKWPRVLVVGSSRVVCQRAAPNSQFLRIYEAICHQSLRILVYRVVGSSSQYDHYKIMLEHTGYCSTQDRYRGTSDLIPAVNCGEYGRLDMDAWHYG